MAGASFARVHGNQDGRCSCGEDPRIVRVPSCSLPPGTFPRTARASLRASPRALRSVRIDGDAVVAGTNPLPCRLGFARRRHRHARNDAGRRVSLGTTAFFPRVCDDRPPIPFPPLRTSPSKLACILPRPPWTFPSSLGRHPFRHVTFAPGPTLVSKRSEKKLPSRHGSQGDPPSGEETPSGPSTLPSEACFHPSALQASD